MFWWLKLLFFLLQGSFFFKICQGYIECDCSTEECRIQGKTMCRANNYCYVEAFDGDVTRGCIDERTPLLCENRPPEKTRKNSKWPVLYCCKNDDFCNRVVMPSEETKPEIKEEEEIPEEEPQETVEPVGNCPDNLSSEESDSSKIFNPIYIAVPVAGVCVLLALIIFAMYLLRRRNDYYETYHYHENAASSSIPQKHCDGKTSNGKINRCTDSERSSQGSETKLFLQEHV